MAGLVGQYQQTSFSTPANGDGLDADVVRSNDNNVRAVHNSHDNDGSIHLQSGLHASRPAASTAGDGAKWISTDTGRLYFSDGSAWTELDYVLPGDSISALTVTSLTTTSVSGDGSALTNLTAANLTGTLPAVSGANLTNLNATNLSSGTVAAARLPSTVSAMTITTLNSTTATATTLNGATIRGSGSSDGQIKPGASETFFFVFDTDPNTTFIDSTTPTGALKYLRVSIGGSSFRIAMQAD